MPVETGSLESTRKKAAVNFSRPNFSRPQQREQQSQPVELESGKAKAVDASDHNESDAGRRNNNRQHMPEEPRFSIDSVIRIPSGSGSEPISDFTWDETRGELVTRRGAQLRIQDQRHPGPPVRSQSSSTVSTTAERRPDTKGTTASRSSSVSVRPAVVMPKSILKSTSVEITSERANSEAGEDGMSHHAVSESDSGSYDENGKWHASDHDTSMLTEKEIKKLQKKGINPSLYMEMKAAKKGKSFIGALTGNTYVS